MLEGNSTWTVLFPKVPRISAFGIASAMFTGAVVEILLWINYLHITPNTHEILQMFERRLFSVFFPDILMAMATTRNVMRAVRVFEFGGPEVLKLQSDVLIPVPKENQVCELYGLNSYTENRV